MMMVITKPVDRRSMCNHHLILFEVSALRRAENKTRGNETGVATYRNMEWREVQLMWKYTSRRMERELDKVLYNGNGECVNGSS